MSSALFFHQNDLALVDDADPVGHLFGLVDVMRGQDDGARRSSLSERTSCPHVAPELDVDAGGRLVEEQDLRLVRQRLGDEQARASCRRKAS